ncbi:hypothetical protein LCGC14_1145410 [marine sediment metagenome]|uniref:Uncharacterized protein n=1 Tax=marine sediment metagenome TaxID=412755 RepID=A0A0F9Q2Q6_9ZZZZ
MVGKGYKPQSDGRPQGSPPQGGSGVLHSTAQSGRSRNRKYNIEADELIKSFIYTHYQATGWQYCVLVYDAWKFSSSLRCVNIFLNGSLEDYLIVEQSTMDDAVEFCNKLAHNNPRLSIWEDGKLLLDSKYDKEFKNGCRRER